MNRCKIITVVGNAGDPSTADTKVAVPSRRERRRKTRCNCHVFRGKHVRTADCEDPYEPTRKRT
jgi:hypothetical protein